MLEAESEGIQVVALQLHQNLSGGRRDNQGGLPRRDKRMSLVTNYAELTRNRGIQAIAGLDNKALGRRIIGK